MKFAGLICLLLFSLSAKAIELEGQFTQGGLVFGKVAPGTTVILDERVLQVSTLGDFILGFGRDAPKSATLQLQKPDGSVEKRQLKISQRKYRIQRIDGLPKKMVTPPAAVLARIRKENAAIARVRTLNSKAVHFRGTWLRPAPGKVTGVYGSQRVLNGKPRRPHFGIDFAAPVGTTVIAPAGGTVVLAHPDMYYTGGTIILDHGHGLTSAFLHLSALAVKNGDVVQRGQHIGAIGATGRATGPHLDWRINWFDQRVDPAFLLSEQDRK